MLVLYLKKNNIDMQFMIKSQVNPLPQACGLYLYSDQDNIKYNDDDNFINQNIIGYRPCAEQTIIREDQNDYFVTKVIGDCINCIVKDVYISSSSSLSYKKSSSNIPIIIIFSLIGFIIISIYVICKHNNKFKNYYYYYYKQLNILLSSSSSQYNNNISENTPLLNH
eukprot:275879_1